MKKKKKKTNNKVPMSFMCDEQLKVKFKCRAIKQGVTVGKLLQTAMLREVG